MAEAPRSSALRGTIGYCVIMLAILLARLSPITTTPDHLPLPDMMLVMTCLFVVRQPARLPALLIAVVFLLSDMLLQRPPGLMTLLVLIGTEFLRLQSRLIRAGSRAAEWSTVGAVIAAIFVAERLAMALLLLPLHPLFHSMAILVLSVLAYPITGWIAALLFGLRLHAPGELDYRGRRI